MPALPAVLTPIIEKLVKHYQPEKIILFGSYARGTATPESDLDLCVVKDDPRSHRKKSSELRLLLRGTPIPIDIIALRHEELSDASKFAMIQWEINRTGIIVYEQGRA